jgi:hypothetical protein
MNTYKIEAIIRKGVAPKYKEYFVEDCNSSLEAIMKYFDGCPFMDKVDILRVYPIY